MLNLNKYNRITVRLILVAFSITVLAAPKTIADYSSQVTRAGSGDYSSQNLIPNGGFDGNLFRRNSETRLNYIAASLPGRVPAATYAAPSPPSCAPRLQFFSTFVWYEVLNNTNFNDWSCNPNWFFPVGYFLPRSTICNTNPLGDVAKEIAVLPYASGFSQNFFVPNDATGQFDISLMFAIVGTPTANDRIILELREGSLVRSKITIRTDGLQTSCRRRDYTFPSNLVGGSFAGRNLRLRVTSQIVTPGVEFHINSISTFVYIP